MYKSLPSYVAAHSIYASIKVPVTLVYGEHDWSRLSDREATLAKIPGAELITLQNTGHFSSLERPDQFARILIDTKSAFTKVA